MIVHPIRGHCPMGCGATLTSQNWVIKCMNMYCPRPTAVDELLQDNESEHIVDLANEGSSIRHPLRERLNNALLDCDLHHYLCSLDGPPVPPGRYRARLIDGSWTWEAYE